MLTQNLMDQFLLCNQSKEYLAKYETVEEAWNNCEVSAWMQYMVMMIGLHKLHKEILTIRNGDSYCVQRKDPTECECIRQVVPFKLFSQTLQHVYEKRITDKQRIHDDLLLSSLSKMVICPAAKEYLSRFETVQSAWHSCETPTWMRYVVYSVGLIQEHIHIICNIYNSVQDNIDKEAAAAIRRYVSVNKLITNIKEKWYHESNNVHI